MGAEERTATTTVAGPGAEGLEVREAQRYLARYSYLFDVERPAVD